MSRIVIVGGGVAGLAAARTVRAERPDVELLLLEASDRPGGLVRTERTPEGFVIEHGPDSLATTKPAGMRAVRELGLEDRVVEAGEAPRRSFVVRDDTLVPLPQGLFGMGPGLAWTLARSPLLSWRGKARLARERFVPPRDGEEDESVASFFERRFGREMVDRLVDPLLTSIYGTGTDQLSVQATMPRLVALERKHGSVSAAMASMARGRTAPAGPALVSFPSGMGELGGALASGLNGAVRCGARVWSVTRGAAGFRVEVNGEALEADGVVLAVPAWAAARMVEAADPDLADDLAAIRYASLCAVSLGYAAEEVPHPLDGTGFVVPAAEGRHISACTWSSRKWPGRAPEGTVLLRAFVREGVPADEDPVPAVREDLRALMGIEAVPRFVDVRRMERALPRCEVGHPGRVRALHERAAGLGPFALAGTGHGSTGIPDCIDGGVEAAHRVLAQLND